MKNLSIEMPDGTEWLVPVHFIAENRAKYFSEQYKSYTESFEATIILFDSRPGAIVDWAANQMEWSDIKDVAKLVDRPKCDDIYEEGWKIGNMMVIHSD
jgi:hypothetical protein